MEPKCVWFGMYLGHVQQQHADGSVSAYFHDQVGGPGYVLRLWAGEWRAA